MTSPSSTRLDVATAGRILASVRAREGSMVDHLLHLAHLESPSADRTRQAPVLDHLEAELVGRGWRTRRHVGERTGGMLLGAPPSTPPAGFQLLVGHGDTVWPVGTTHRRPPRRDGDFLWGPGTFDMKAGLVQTLTVLDVLAELELVPEVGPVLLVNSDEEIGSRESTWLIRELATAADRVLVLEPSMGPQGAVKTARKGLGRYTVTVQGKAAHAGLDPTSGASAILELSAVIQALFALNDAERGVTVNVGMVSGGIQPNVVAPQSSAVVDVRVLNEADAVRVDAAIRGLEPSTPGTTVAVDGGMGRPPLERTTRNEALYAAAVDVATTFGVELPQDTAGGGSDGNTTSQVAPTLDGLGAVGDGAHAEHEHVVVSRWLERTAVLAGLVLLGPIRSSDEPARGGALDPFSLEPEVAS